MVHCLLTTILFHRKTGVVTLVLSLDEFIVLLHVVALPGNRIISLAQLLLRVSVYERRI